MPEPSQELREAAKLMRETAEAATGGRWQHMCMGSEGCAVLNNGHLRDRKRVAFFGRKEWKADHADAGYVASMDPPVALAVAGWLDDTAAELESVPAGAFPVCNAVPALKVARAYLGTGES
jgi:hypothetical protein